MKYKIVYFFFLFLSGFLYAMELVPFLEKKAPECEDILHDNSRELERHMFGKLVLLHYAAEMPLDVWREIHTKIADVTFERDKEFEETFYAKPFTEALQLYQRIQRNVGYNKPIAPLYKMNQQNRDFILRMLDTWCVSDYIDPIMCIEDQQMIHEFDDDVRQYFHGKRVRVVSFRNEQMYRDGLLAFATITSADCMIGSLMLSLACCLAGPEFACSPVFLGVSLGIPSGLECILGFPFLFPVIRTHCDQSNKVTL